MQTASTAYGTFAAGNDATTVVRVTIAWPAAVPASYQTLADLSVQAYNITEETQTDMPDGTRYVTGRAAASCNLTLAGLLDRTDDTKTVAWLLGQYQSTSPMYRTSPIGLSVTVDVGILTGDPTMTTPGFEGVEFVRGFTGRIDDYEVDSANGTVQLTCLDGRAEMFGAAAIPLAYSDPAANSVIATPLTALWPLRFLMANAGFYDSPPPRPTCLLYASFHGSAWPEVSTNGFAEVGKQLDGTENGFTAGFWSPQVVDPAGQLMTVIGECSVSLATGVTLFGEGWINIPASGFAGAVITNWQVANDNGGANDLFRFEVIGDASTGLNFHVLSRRGTATGSSGTDTNWTSSLVSTAAGWTQVSWSFTYTTATTAAVNVWVNGSLFQSASFTVVAVSSEPFRYLATACSILADAVAADTMQITLEPTSAVPVTGFVPSAVLDASLNRLTAIPSTAGDDQWAVAQAIATAEQGIVGIDENGKGFFRSRASVQSGASVRTIDRNSSLISLTTQNTQAAKINHVQVPVNKLQVGPLGVVWSAAEAITVPARGSYVQQITTDNPVVNVARTDSGEMPSGGGTLGNTYWRACKSIDGAGTRVNSGITIRCVRVAPSLIQMTVNNANAFPVFLVSPIGVGFPASSNGQPAVNIGGQFILTDASAADGSVTTASGAVGDAQYPPLQYGGAASAPGGESLLAVPANPWMQQATSAQALADDLLSDLHSDRPQWSAVIVTDRRLQRGDRVTVNDPDVTGITNEDAIIADLHDNGDSTTTVGLRAVFPPGAWLLGIAGRSELGVTTYI